MAKDDEIEKILREVKTNHRMILYTQIIGRDNRTEQTLRDDLWAISTEELQAIKAYADKQARATLDSLIDDEIKNYEVYSDDAKICVGIKLMADNIREKYDQLEGDK